MAVSKSIRLEGLLGEIAKWIATLSTARRFQKQRLVGLGACASTRSNGDSVEFSRGTDSSEFRMRLRQEKKTLLRGKGTETISTVGLSIDACERHLIMFGIGAARVWPRTTAKITPGPSIRSRVLPWSSLGARRGRATPQRGPRGCSPRGLGKRPKIMRGAAGGWRPPPNLSNEHLVQHVVAAWLKAAYRARYVESQDD